MSLRFWKILAAPGFAVTLGCSSVSAQECIIPSSDLIGVMMGNGTCYGAMKALAKIMKIEVSQCNPSPKNGAMILGRCVPAAPVNTATDTRSTDERIQALTEVVRELKNEIDALRADMSVQNHETASDFERLYSRIGR